MVSIALLGAVWSGEQVVAVIPLLGSLVSVHIVACIATDFSGQLSEVLICHSCSLIDAQPASASSGVSKPCQAQVSIANLHFRYDLITRALHAVS